MHPRDWIPEINHLLDRPLLEFHINELNKLLAKARKNSLTPSDEQYIKNLWDRFHSLPPKEDKQNEKPVEPPTPPNSRISENPELVKAQKLIEELREERKRLALERDKWEDRAINLERKVKEIQRFSTSDRKFREAKRAFAKLYHPNSQKSISPLEAAIRNEIFKEFWAQLEEIEAREP